MNKHKAQRVRTYRYAAKNNTMRINTQKPGKTATWNLAGITPLPAAWYTATLDATQVTSASGLMLDGNGDGTEGDAYTQTLLVAKRGDANLNGYIDIGDFNTLVENYDPLGQTGSVDWSMADFDGDGDVDISDFSDLVRNFSPTTWSSRNFPEARTISPSILETMR